MRFFVLMLCALELLAQRPQRVLVIGIDGMSVAGMRMAKLPNLNALMAGGAYSLKARGVLPTVSSPNWASIIMGAGPEQHGVTSNDWQRDKYDIEPVCKGTDTIFPTIFGVLHAAKPSLALAAIYDWDGFGRLFEKDTLTYDKRVEHSAETVKAAIEYWKQGRPDFLFVHLDDVDHAGHGHGWEGEVYLSEANRIDALIGDLVAASRADKPLIIVVADHGGMGTKHGNNTTNELLIPLIVSGPGVKAGEVTRPIYNYDVAATVAAAFGVQAHPCWIGKPITVWK